MINKNTRIGKLIDSSKVVYECIICSRRYIGDAEKIPTCSCGHKDTIVIVDNLSVMIKQGE